MKSKKLKILFLYPNFHMSTLVPNGIAILVAWLKREGFNNIDLFETTFYDTDDKSKDQDRVEVGQVQPFNYADRGVKLKITNMYDDFTKKVNEFEPDIIMASILEDTFKIFITFMEKIKDKKIPCLAGGQFPSSAPEKVIALDFVNYVCRGEGEEALVELCDALEEGKDITKIANLWVKKSGKIIARNKIRQALDVNKLPVQDLSIFEDMSLFRPMQGKIYRMAPVETQRGCPYACRFCNSPEKNEFYEAQKAGRFFRKRTMKHLHTELKELISKYSIEYIFFITDTFLAMSEKEFDEFCEIYSEFKLPFYMHTRPETVTERKVKKLKEVNCDRVNIGVEHGNHKFRSETVGRNYKNEVAIRSFEMMYEGGISTVSNSILGYPDETRELIFDTIELVRKLKCTDINAFTFTPYHGTSLRELCERKKYLAKDTLADGYYVHDSLLTMPSITKEEIRGLMKTFVLYSRLPRSSWPEIKIAEAETELGKNKYGELMAIFRREYAHAPLASEDGM
jgi:radical SAM superfamily enzyme YgiQ (UPF0313 family)|tara:strand:- start:30 stop:1562 length:1533 start_codon:yes stop_codon:yes gene_type:complete